MNRIVLGLSRRLWQVAGDLITDMFGMKLRQHLLNTILIVASISCTYLVIELVFFRILLPQLSLNLKTHLPDTAGVLVQASKTGFIPHDYIALLGDSYAEGVGDWLLQANGDRTKPFHSADIIREATKRDVVSFGRVGAGSAEALVARPARIFGGTECYLFPEIEKPRDLVVYFYGGNDVDDNDRFLGHVAKRYGDASDDSIDRFLTSDYGAPFPWWKCHTYLVDTAARMAKFLFLHHLQDGNLDPNPPQRNLLIVAGERIPAPSLPGPSLKYTDDQVIAAMRVFERSLRWLRDRFPDIPVTVVYIPSQASIYHFASDTIVTNIGGRQELSATEAAIAKRSDLICDLARTVTLSHGATFLDAHPTLRRAAETHVIHGPIDWVHFNEAGYRALGSLVTQQAISQHQ